MVIGTWYFNKDKDEQKEKVLKQTTINILFYFIPVVFF